MSDIEIVVRALQDRAGLKPNTYVAQKSLEALERLVTQCGCVDDESRVLIKQAQQSVSAKVEL